MAVEVSDEEFERLVDQAWAQIPDRFKDELENVLIVIEDEPSSSIDLLGLYSGVPITDRADYSGAMPDQITLYQGPLQRHCQDERELAEQVYVTLVHEIGHYFGLDEDRLHELDWG